MVKNMFGKLNPKDMEAAMRKLGIKSENIPATEVRIATKEGKTIVIKQPQVMVIDAQGQKSFQITGVTQEIASEKPLEIELSNDDVELVAEQAEVTKEQAREALEETQGDIAQAIMQLKGEKEKY